MERDTIQKTPPPLSMGKSIPIQTFSDEIVGWYLLCIYTPTNMYQFTDLHLAISKKLGWGDMLAEIALPAINHMASSLIHIITIETGNLISNERALESVSKDYTPDECFGLLAPIDFITKSTLNEMVNDFISLRGEIEDYMRRGYNYQEAIAEWFK